jgi:hypothetical protein
LCQFLHLTLPSGTELSGPSPDDTNQLVVKFIHKHPF